MRVAIVLFAVASIALGAPSHDAAPAVVVAAPATIVASAVSKQHHAQDELGQYNYGYTNPLSAKEELKTADGITRGGYSYLDAHGLVQSVNYVSDDVNGFRVAATNLPAGPVAPVEDEPVVAQAKAVAHAAANEASRPIVVAPIPENIISVVAKDTPAVEIRPIVVAESPVPAPAVIAAPAVAVNPPVLIKSAPAPTPQLVQATPVLVSDYTKGPVVPVQESPVVAVPPAVISEPVLHTKTPEAVVSVPVIAATITAQHHSQDELGQYSYGYVNPLSAKEEISTADGITKGGYSYLDSHGLVQNVNYVSDDVNGFRVAASNIPQQVQPVEIPDSPEVAAAKEKFFTAIAQAKAAVEH